jgi:hypothetical protein
MTHDTTRSSASRHLGRCNRRRTDLHLSAIAVLAVGFVFAPSIGRAQSTAAAVPAQASPADVDQLRQEIETLRREYDARIADLERRLSAVTNPASAGASANAATTGTAPGTPPEPAAPASPPQAPTVAAPQPTAPPATEATPPPPAPAAPGAPATSLPSEPGRQAVPAGNVFNPDIAVIGNVLGAAGTNPEDNTPALRLSEAEASFQAIIDPYARGDFFFSVGPNGAEVEEGFITFTSLPGGLLVKAGKMRAQFGKVNAMHTHVLPWTDRPLVTRNLVGGEEGISDGGVTVAKLVPNRFMFLEATGEVFGGRTDVFAGSERSHVTYLGRLRGYRDLTEGTNLDVGTSFAYGHTDVAADATRTLFGVDATFRWRPLRRAIYRRFIGRTELVWNQDRLASQRPTVFGMYASGEYQFAQRWFAGGRYDYSQRPLAASLADKGGAATLTFWPSEFSQVRGQYRRTNYAEGVTANEFLFQFLFSIGAHGAHVF